MSDRLLVVFAVALLLSACGGGGAADPASGEDSAAGPTVRVGAIEISGSWSRIVAGVGDGAMGAAYMTIRNSGAEPDTLMRVEGSVARAIELHTMELESGVMKMNPVGPAGVVIPAGGEVTLATAGLHIMLIGVSGPPKPGETVALKLMFARAGAVTIECPVRANG